MNVQVALNTLFLASICNQNTSADIFFSGGGGGGQDSNMH